MNTPDVYNKITFRNVPVRSDDYEALEIAKQLYENDFHRQVTWSDFLMSLATGFCIGRSMLLNESKFNLLVEEESPATPQLQRRLHPRHQSPHSQGKKQP